MFEIFSWNDYLFGLLIAAVGYYIFVAIIFYRKEVLNPSLFVKKDNNVERSIKSTNNQPDLLGKTRSDSFPASKHISLDDPNQLVIAEAEPKSIYPETSADEVLLIGSVADLLQEAKTLIHVIAENESEKEQALSMIQSLISRYNHLSETKFKSAINLFILDLIKADLSIDMNPADIDQLWN